MSTLVRLAILCSLAVVTCARPAWACSCALLPLCTTFWEADLVFIGQADVTALGPGAQRARFEVEESFRGPADRAVEIVGRGIGGSCDYGFVHGTRYIVFARRAPDGSWKASLCGSTVPVAQAGEAITFARTIARDSRRTGSVSGSVMAVQKASNGRVESYLPLGGVRIVMRDAGRDYSTNADPTGSYQFKDVPVGRYTLTVSAYPGVQAIPPAVVEVKGPGACVTHPITALKQ